MLLKCQLKPQHVNETAQSRISNTFQRDVLPVRQANMSGKYSLEMQKGNSNFIMSSIMQCADMFYKHPPGPKMSKYSTCASDY